MVSVGAFLERLRGKRLAELLRLAPQFAEDHVRSRVTAAFYWGLLHATSAARESRRQAALDRLEGAERILFLCRGNICRSPFAERYARRVLADRGIDTLHVDSGGSICVEDPRSPPNARRVGRDYGIDLRDHLAVKSALQSIETADLILVMDYQNFHTFVTRFPELSDRLFLLRTFDPDPKMEIHDPHGYDVSVFEQAYSEIVTGVMNLVDEYESLSR